MKKIFSLIVFFASVIMAYAQEQCIATLRKSDGTVSVFYGTNALVDAHAAAEKKGSVITLSSGVFSGTTITKSITLRGAGMERDTIAKREATIIYGRYGRFELHNTDSVTIEGIRFDYEIRIRETNSNTTFLKSRIEEFDFVSANLKNAFFINCKITKQLYMCGEHITCVNSVINDLSKQRGNSQILVCKNCVIKIGSGDPGSKIANAHGGRFEDCLIFSPYKLDASTMASNCLGFNSADIFVNNTIPTCTYISDPKTVFKTYTGGNIIDGETFELTEEAQSKYLGDDGTQVGIYGGFYPYNPTTTAPQIKKFDVARKTTADGKLEVDIEVIATAGGN